jgi:phosphate starvation-inducible protein PhoH
MADEKNATLRRIVLPERGIEALFGTYDENIKTLEELLSVRVTVRGNDVVVEGDAPDVDAVQRIVEDYAALVREGRKIGDAELKSAFKQIAEDRAYTLREHMTSARINPTGKKQVTARSANQRRYIETIEQNDIVFGIGPAGTGKCIAADSLVLTDGGMIEIASLGAHTRAGDHVPIRATIQGLDGAELASHVYNGGESDTISFRTRLGFAIEVTPEHPLLTLDEAGALAWRRADSLRPGDVLALQHGQRVFGKRTTVGFEYAPRNPYDDASKPVNLEEIDEELAYIMGALTGDGCLTQRNRIVLTSADESLVAAFYGLAARFGLRVFPNGGEQRPYDHVIVSSQLYQLFEHLDLSTGKARTKRIPRSVLTAPESIVAAFLRGLFDTDGTIERRDGLVSLNSVSERLMREVQIVLLNFGVVASRSVKKGRYQGKPHRSHLLTIAGAEAERFHELIGFGLERKRARRQARPPNTNVDVVSHLGPSIRAAVATATFSRLEHKLFDDYRRERRRPSYIKLAQILGSLDAHAAQGCALDQMRDLVERRLLFAEIVAAEPSRAQVFDLTVPGTHSFVANGFINHNTYLAVAMAIQALWAKRVNRIVLARPAVEAGEKLGFLPGDLQDKVDPYLRPLYDALFDLVDYEKITKLLEKRVIEIAPLAFMRGRTLSDAFIILDEAQNTTSEQMKMFLTRIGFGSRAVITGDITQIDLPSGRRSGLVEAQRVIAGIEGIEFIYFTDKDVVRHKLVQMIIRAYDDHGKARFDETP